MTICLSSSPRRWTNEIYSERLRGVVAEKPKESRVKICRWGMLCPNLMGIETRTEESSTCPACKLGWANNSIDFNDETRIIIASHPRPGRVINFPLVLVVSIREGNKTEPRLRSTLSSNNSSKGSRVNTIAPEFMVIPRSASTFSTRTCQRCLSKATIILIDFSSKEVTRQVWTDFPCKHPLAGTPTSRVLLSFKDEAN